MRQEAVRVKTGYRGGGARSRTYQGLKVRLRLARVKAEAGPRGRTLKTFGDLGEKGD